MVRDAVANVVMRLMNCGYDPRKVGDDAWELRCPAHRSPDHALAITRNAFNHVTLECRSAGNCAHSRIVSALGLTNEHLYAETPDGWVRRLALVPVQSASPSVTRPSRAEDGGLSNGAMASTSAGTKTVLADERRTSTDAGVASTAGQIIAEIDGHEEGRQGDATMRDVGNLPPHTDSLPVGARALSDSSCRAEPEDTVSSPCPSSIGSADTMSAASTAAPPPHLDPLPVVKTALSRLPRHADRDVIAAPAIEKAPPPGLDTVPVTEPVIDDLHCSAVREREAGSQDTSAELLPAVDDPVRGGFENSASGSMGIVFSSISVNVDRADMRERQSSVQILARLASNARLFQAADGRFCRRFRWVIGSKFLGSARRRFATG